MGPVAPAAAPARPEPSSWAEVLQQMAPEADDVEVSMVMHGGTPIAGWFISWKIPLKKDENWQQAECHARKVGEVAPFQ